MSTDPDTTRIVRSWLDEGVTQLPDRVLDRVLDQVPATPQRRAIGWPARRLSTMNSMLKFGLAAAVVAVAALIGFNYFAGRGIGQPDVGGPSATPEPAATPRPSTAAQGGLPQGPYRVNGADAPVLVSVDIASDGWHPLPQFEALGKADDGLDPPEAVGAGLLASAWEAGTQFQVYADPCQWSTGGVTSATTPDEIAAALSDQAMTDPTEPVDVTVDGYAGKAITLHVPMSFAQPGATRDEVFGDCDDTQFNYYGAFGEPMRNAQGAGQVDELWIVDVEGRIVILDATYGPAAPASLVGEVRALAESATFEVP